MSILWTAEIDVTKLHTQVKDSPCPDASHIQIISIFLGVWKSKEHEHEGINKMRNRPNSALVQRADGSKALECGAEKLKKNHSKKKREKISFAAAGRLLLCKHGIHCCQKNCCLGRSRVATSNHSTSSLSVVCLSSFWCQIYFPCVYGTHTQISQRC